MKGAKVFVAIAFLFLAAAFLCSTALLIYEFRDLDWDTLVIAHSYLFYFFPVLGLLALFAFYLPSVVFTDFYWRHHRVRFLIGLALLAVLSVVVANYLDKPPRSIWEASPTALVADRGDIAGQRVPILAALADVREKAQTRLGLSSFARSCEVDPLLEVPEEISKERYCFPAKTRMDGYACCAVQAQFADAVGRLYENPQTRSLSAKLDGVFFLPIKIFFVLLVIAIGLLLALWRNHIEHEYRDLVARIEAGVIIGAFAMLCWPAMDYGYQQTANALFGRMQSGPQLRLSLVIAPWVLLLLFYFLTRLGKQGETIGQISGVVVAAVAVLRYEQLNDLIGRLFGVGAAPAMLIGQALLAMIGFVVLLWFRRADHRLRRSAAQA